MLPRAERSPLDVLREENELLKKTIAGAEEDSASLEQQLAAGPLAALPLPCRQLPCPSLPPAIPRTAACHARHSSARTEVLRTAA